MGIAGSEIPSLDPLQVDSNQFVLSAYPAMPRWRPPQRGALEAISSYWALEESEPALASMPTGSGKTAVAIALRYLARSRRTLVVVPNQELRRQIAQEFASEQTLLNIGALIGGSRPAVHEHVGRNIDWESLRRHDVVIAIPSSISPAVMVDNPPPVDLFDLVIFDEAHHAPAKTWRAILDHFSTAKAVLLTATPRRRDGRALPGKHVFHYPLRLALQHGIYKPVEPRVLELKPLVTQNGRDQAILDEVVRTAAMPEHVTSAVLIRVATIERANAIAAEYAASGLDCLPLHTGLSKKDRDKRLSDWRAGGPKALAVVDMLGEGIDVPNLRIVGYHDKHKSDTATVQLIGRLARSNRSYPQASVLVTVRDHDVFPALQGVLRQLYEEDTDWGVVLPALIDAELEDDQARRQFAAQFTEAPPNLSVSALRPLARIIVFESVTAQFAPEFADGSLPDELEVGRLLRGQEIVYSGVHASDSMLVVVTSAPSLPRWYGGDSLTQAAYDLHVATWHPSPEVGVANLLFINTEDAHIGRELRLMLDPDTFARLGRPDAVQAAFESIERISVSNVGVRNTHRAGAGTTTYAMFSGSGVDRGLRDADTHGRGLGHAMAQIVRDGSSVNVGFSAGKAKYWETRYIPLLDYFDFAVDFATRYRDPKVSASGTFLPDVSRSLRTDKFENAALIAEFNPALRGQGWLLESHVPIEDLEMEVGGTSEEAIELTVLVPATGEVVWEGIQTPGGQFIGTGVELRVRRGPYQRLLAFERLLEAGPPSIYLTDGSMVYGQVTYSATQTQTNLPSFEYTSWDWSSTDVAVESKRPDHSDSIHDLIERKLVEAGGAVDRWIVCNDGKSEIADHIVIERNPLGRLRVELWHAKATHGTTPSVRVNDMQVVTVQALKSRRHLTDKDFWRRLGRRLEGAEPPMAHVIDGDIEMLRAMCGLIPEREAERVDEFPPQVDGRIVVVQPGLSINRLQTAVEEEPIETAVGQVREFLVALHNATAGSALVEIIGSA